MSKRHASEREGSGSGARSDLVGKSRIRARTSRRFRARYPQVGGGAASGAASTFTPREAALRSSLALRRYGFDARESSRRTAIVRHARARGPGHDDRRARRRTTLWFAIPGDRGLRAHRSSRAGAFPSPPRRRYWLLAAALSFVDGRLVPFVGQRLRRRAWPPRSCSATCATTLQARLGLAVVLGRCDDRRLQHSRALRPASSSSFRSVFAIAWLAGFALRERSSRPRPRKHVRRQRRAGARGGGPHRGRRGAGADRARAPRRRRPRGQRHGAPGRRRPAQAPATRSRRTAMRSGASSRQAARRSPRCAASSERCGRDGDDRRARAPAGPRRPRLAARRDRPRRASASRLHVEGEPPRRFRAALDLSAYRIVQEGLTNALKHARASHADVTVRYGPDELQIEVRDDGRRPIDERRPRSRPRRHARARHDLRRRDERRSGERRRLRPQRPPPARRRPAMTIRVLVADDQSTGPRRLPHAARRRGGHRGRGRGEQRARGGRQGRPLQPDGRADGHPHARARRARGDAADPRRRRHGPDPDPDHVRPRRVRLRGAARRRQRVRPQGRPAGAAHRRDPHRRARRCASLARGHEARDRAVRAHPARRAPERARRADGARA